MGKLATWSNDLHSGEKSYAIVGKRRWWLSISLALVALCIVILVVKPVQLGIEFRGGTEYTLAGAAAQGTDLASETVVASFPDELPRVTRVGENSIRVQLGTVTNDESLALGKELAAAYGIAEDQVSSSVIGASWGSDVSGKAFQGLIIFLVLVTLVMVLYFRTWAMALSGLVALLHDLVFTVGIYALVGFEVTPASVIGFLTILGYSLYDTVVVFDKVRENTAELQSQHRFTYAELANLALNQTLVRSINTSIVALLPVSAVLFIGSFLLGATALEDFALALFVGMAVGAYSSLFVATPLDVVLRNRESKIVKHTADVLALREAGATGVVLNEDGTVRVGALEPGHHQGTAAQPKRKRRA